MASIPHGITVEVDQTGNPFIEDLLVRNFRVANGEIEMPQGPGLGIELDEAVVEKYSLKPGEATPDGNYSDMVFGANYYAPAGPYIP